MKWCRKKKREFVRPLEEQQAEKLAELGEILRCLRQEKDFPLEKIAAKTLIQRRLLQAIEQGKLDELPEPIYIQSFIKQYADTLGLNGQELSSSFPISDHHQLLVKRSWKIPVPQLRPIHLYLLYIFVVICSVNGLSQMLSRSNLQVSDRQTQQPQIQPILKPERQTQQSEKLNFSSKSVRIGVTLKAQSWIRVVADGKTEFEGILPEGTQRTWVAQEKLTVLADNAGAVLVTFNQEKAMQMGNPGEPQEVTFAAKQRS